MNNELITPAEALQQFGISWDIGTQPLYWNPPLEISEGDYTKVDSNVIHRTDNNEILGVVSNRYEPFSNQQFASAITEIIGTDAPTIISGGEFRGGKGVWMQSDLGGYSIGGVDLHRRYALFYTSHDGGGCMGMLANDERCSCSNQFSGMDRSQSISIRHTHGMRVSMDRARACLQGIETWFDTFTELNNHLANQPMDRDWLSSFFERSYVGSMPASTQHLLADLGTDDPAANVSLIVAEREAVEAKRERAKNRMESHLQIMAANFQGGYDQAGGTAPEDGNVMPYDLLGTKYHALNAFTHYIDHDSGRSAESVKMGAANVVKNDALKLASIL